MSNQEARPPRRWRRWIGRFALVVASGLALLGIALAVVLGSLDRPWLKGRLRALVRQKAGIQLDYRALKLRPFSGLWLDGLVIATPEPLRALTPELARVDHLEAHWSLSSLLGGGPKIRTAVIDGVSVAIAQDATGRTSLDLLGPPGPAAKPEKPGPPAPLSHLPSQIFSGAAPIGRLDVTGVQASFVRAQPDGAVQRDAIRGFYVTLSTRAVRGGWAASLGAGSPGAPLAVDVTRQGPSAGAAHLTLALGLNGDPQGLALALDLAVTSQDLAPVHVARLLHVDAAVRPDRAGGHTAIEVSRLTAADDAVELSLRADARDGFSQLSIPAVDGHVDLAHLLGALPKGTVPVTLEGGRLQLHLAQLELRDGAPRLAAGGSAGVDLDLPRARVPVGKGALTLARVRAGVSAQPAGDDRWSARVTLRVEAADLSGQTPLSARGTRLEARADQMKIDAAAPAASAGTVKLEGGVAALDVRTPALRAAVDRLGLRFDAKLSGKPPYAANLEVPVEGLLLTDGRVRRLLATPARVSVSLAQVQPDLQRPIASRGDLRAGVELGAVQVSADAHKRPDDVDVDLALKASSLDVARPFLPPDLARKLDWAHLAVDLQTKARVQRLATPAPFVKQQTSLHVDGLRSGRTSARRLALLVSSNGDARRHEADLSLSARGISLDGHQVPDANLHLTAAADRRRPYAKLHLDADGGAHLALDASAGLAPGGHRLDADVDLQADRLLLAGILRPLVPALEGIDLRRTAIRLQAHAGVTGVVERIGRSGDIRPTRDPLHTAGGAADLTVHLADLAVTQGATQVGLRGLDWKVGLRGASNRRELSSEVRADMVRLASGEQRLTLARLQDTTAAVLTGDPATGPVDLTNQLVLTGLRQDLAPFVPTDEITLALAARRQADGLIEISELRLADAKAGTSVSLTGAVDLATDRRLSVRGRVDQDLSKLSPLPSRMAASGHLGLALSVDSPDLEAFRTRAVLALDGVELRAPAIGLAVEGADAQIPVDLRVVMGPQGLKIPRDVRVNPYASLRFSDQEPLQAQSSFLSIARLTTPIVTIAPLAGNLSIDQNVLSLGQLEMGVRGGRVTGQCTLDWQGNDAKIETRIRATGVQSSHGEPFDGDAALVVSTGERSIEGRAQILRIGKRHLLDLLDVQDPHRVDPAMNRIRHALVLGYPDQVRIAFSHGFASARVTLGGLARLIRIDEIRGIPTGSLLDKVLASPARSETE